MGKYERITVKPMAGALGAEVEGVDLRNLDDQTFNELYQAWLDHLVVFLRDQDISPEEQVAFAKRFG
ncbi:MAG: TauD/TfdA family dioxygenase, partial [Pseudomonadota bacterium]